MFPFYIVQVLLFGFAVWATFSFLIALVCFAAEAITNKCKRGNLHPAHCLLAILAWTLFALSILAK